MNEKRRGLGRGLGALIPTAPVDRSAGSRPTDVFFRDVPQDADGAGSAESFAERSPNEREPRDPHQSDRDESGRDRSERTGGEWPGSDGTHDGGPEAPVSATDAPASPVSDGQEGLAPVPGARFAEVPIHTIRPNPRQPRTVFDEDDLAELTGSIREIGVLQPIVVRPVDRTAMGHDAGDGAEWPDDEVDASYELVMGERRWRAAIAAGLTAIPAIVRSTSDDAMLRDALLENLHRAQLNPLEEAAAYRQLLDDFGCTHEDLAARLSRSRPQISNTLRLLNLPPLVARRVAAGVISAGHARALLGLPDGAAMERLAQRIVSEGLSVRSVEEIVAMGLDDAAAKQTTRRPQAARPELDDVAARLADRLDTRVTITMGRSKGKMTVEFASVDDLDRILDLLGSAGHGEQ